MPIYLTNRFVFDSIATGTTRHTVGAACLSVRRFLVFLLIFTSTASSGALSPHLCIPEASVAQILGNHPDCVVLVDGPTCTEASARDAGCAELRSPGLSSCGTLVIHEVPDPEWAEREGGAEESQPTGPPARPFSHCAYASRPAGSPCRAAPAPAPPPPSAAARITAALSHALGGGGAASAASAASGHATPAGTAAAGAAEPHVCGGGGLRGMCVPAAALAPGGALAGGGGGGGQEPEHARCLEVACERGLCGAPVPANEGDDCGPPANTSTPSSSPTHPPPHAPAVQHATPCQRRVCRAGRCVAEGLPDGTPCGPAGPCGARLCRGGGCVAVAEEDGVMCGRATACAEYVCLGGECVEERQPDGRLCWHAGSPGAGAGRGGAGADAGAAREGDCPRACLGGRCAACSCGPAFAVWAGSRPVPGLQWVPFPADPEASSFGGYFALLAEELDIPPLPLPPPYNGSGGGAGGAGAGGVKAGGGGGGGGGWRDGGGGGPGSGSAILLCAGCGPHPTLQPGPGLGQDGAVVAGSVGLAVSPVRGGVYVTLDAVLAPNATHAHYALAWDPWASGSPPPPGAAHRWGALSGSYPPPAGPGAGSSPAPAAPPRAAAPSRSHSAWAFVRQRPPRWGLTSQPQQRALYVGLHATVAACRTGSEHGGHARHAQGGGA